MIDDKKLINCKKEHDIASYLKREVMKEILQNKHFERSLECFSGYGELSQLYAGKSESLICVEQNKKTFVVLSENMKKIKNVLLYNSNNIKILENLSEDFDFIDLDPFGNCYSQLKKISEHHLWNKEKFLCCITTGEVMILNRNLARHSFLNEIYDVEKYIGSNIYTFYIDFFNFINNAFFDNKLQMYYQYTYPTSMRIIADIGHDDIFTLTEKFKNELRKTDAFSDIYKNNIDLF